MNENELRRLLTKYSSSYLLIDTTCLIDSLRHPLEFASIIAIFKECNIGLITIDPVLIEYYKGIDNREHLKTKNNALSKFGIDSIPITKEISDYAKEMATVVGNRGKDISATDYFLAATLRKFGKSNVILFTRDHGDFSLNIFDRLDFLPIGYDNEVHTYAFYKFNPGKYKERYSKFY